MIKFSLLFSVCHFLYTFQIWNFIYEIKNLGLANLNTFFRAVWVTGNRGLCLAQSGFLVVRMGYSVGNVTAINCSKLMSRESLILFFSRAEKGALVPVLSFLENINEEPFLNSLIYSWTTYEKLCLLLYEAWIHSHFLCTF